MKISKKEQLLNQSKMIAIGETMSNIAHQWKQPLSIISTCATGISLKRKYGHLTDDELNSNLATIVEKVEYISNVIDIYMDFLKEKKEFRNINIKEIIEKTIKLVEISLQFHSIKLITNLDEFEDFKIYTIPGELQEVLINLINNSIDSLVETSKLEKIIYVNVFKYEKDFTIEIEDTGNGIKEKDIDKIFNQYFTSKDKKGGTGLGLYICKCIVENDLNGKIKASNGKDGAIFSVTIPLNHNE